MKHNNNNRFTIHNRVNRAFKYIERTWAYGGIRPLIRGWRAKRKIALMLKRREEREQLNNNPVSI